MTSSHDNESLEGGDSDIRGSTIVAATARNNPCSSASTTSSNSHNHHHQQPQQQHHHRTIAKGRSFEKLPLKKTLSAHLPRIVAVGGAGAGLGVGLGGAGGRQLANLYGEWSHDSITELQVDPAIYDVDYDDVSEAGSDFTEDYSRHRVSMRETNRLGGKNDDFYDEDDDDDESSLSSAGSFGEDDEMDNDEWSIASSSASSAADSRALHRKVQAGFFVDAVERTIPTITATTTNTPSFDDHLLLDDPTEFSVEEDPLLDMSGALKLFDEPIANKQSTIKDDKDAWSDDDPLESLAPSEPSRIWKETPDGRFVPHSQHHDIDPKNNIRTPPPPLRPLQSWDRPRQSSTHSEESAYSVDSFAGERTPPSKRKISTNETGQSRTRRTKRSDAPILPHRPASPLKPDTRLKFDTSDEEDELDVLPPIALSTLDEVLVFSDDEKDKPTHTTLDTHPIQQLPQPQLNGIEKTLEQRRSGSPNPIVPTPLSILSQSLPPRHWENVTANDHMQYSVDFTRIRISPNEHRAPLKDHSKRSSSKNKKAKDSKKSKKKSSKKSSKARDSSRSLSVSKRTLEDAESDAESVAASISSSGNDDSDDVSIASQDSLDSMDAAGVSKRKRTTTKVLSKEEERKAKKAEKKKRKKEKIRKRGRREDFEEDSMHETPLKSSALAVADRVEAIFTNIQMIYDTTLHEDPAKTAAKNDHCNPSTQSSPLEQEPQIFLEAKSEKIRVRSKAAEAVLDHGKDDKPSNDKDEPSRSRAKSRSKSRSRSVSKDPSKYHRSRSKSKEPLSKPESRSRSKSRHRSSSVDHTKTESTVRRRLKKDSPIDTVAAEPASQVKESQSKTPSKKEKSPDKQSRRSRSPKQRTPRSGTPSLNAMTLQDIIDTDEPLTHDSVHPSLSKDPALLHDSLNAECGDIKSKVDWIARKIAEIEKSTQDELLRLKETFHKRKVDLDAKVTAEKERKSSLEAILLLHKIKANDYQEIGRKLKKELRSMERDMSSEIAKCSELTLKSQEWQMKNMTLLGEIKLVEDDNARQQIEVQQCQREIKRLLHASRDTQFLDIVRIGNFRDYELVTKTPLYRRWREPKQRNVNHKTLLDSYKLPRSSIFYNILEDDECKLTFKS